MNKTELINEMAQLSGLKKKELELALNSFTECVGNALQAGEKVQLIGFGTFETRLRKAREGQNLHTGEKIEIPATTVAAFKPGKALKEKVNSK